jgi:hypothetical protein
VTLSRQSDRQRRSQAAAPSNNQLPEQLLFNVEQASAVLGGLSPRSIRYLISDGVLKTTIMGGRVFLHRTELIRFAAIGHSAPIVPTKEAV